MELLNHLRRTEKIRENIKNSNYMIDIKPNSIMSMRNDKICYHYSFDTNVLSIRKIRKKYDDTLTTQLTSYIKNNKYVDIFNDFDFIDFM